MSSHWKKWACILFGAVFLFLLPEKGAYAQNSTYSDPSHEIIVVFKNRPTVSLLSALSANTSQNLEIKNGIPASNAMVFSVTSGDVNSAMTEVAKDSNVQSVFPNYPLNLQSTTNDPKADSQWQWNLYKLNVAGTGTSAWNVTTGSDSVVAAVIDTGVQSDHQDLAGKIATMVDCSSGTCSTVTSMTDAHPGGHGTHVAGIVAAATNNSLGVAGVAYNTKLMIVKVSSAGPGGAVVTSTDNFFSGIKWVSDWASAHQDKKVIVNTSFGVVADSLTPAAVTEYNNTVAYAWNRGVVIVASAGNCGGNTQGYDACAIHPNGDPGTVAGYAQNSKLYPAASPNVISVAASTTTNVLAGYSEHNDSTNANIGNWIDVTAPGGDGDCSDATKTCVYSTVPTNNYFWDSGTSMSSPAVAGVAALVWAAKTTLTNEQVRNIIKNSANHNILAGSTSGLVDALAAVNLANGTVATSPTPTPTGANSVSPTPTVTGVLSPTPTGTNSVTPTITPTAGPTATPTVTPYPTTPPRLPKTPPNPYPQGPYCPAFSGISSNSPVSGDQLISTPTGQASTPAPGSSQDCINQCISLGMSNSNTSCQTKCTSKVICRESCADNDGACLGNCNTLFPADQPGAQPQANPAVPASCLDKCRGLAMPVGAHCDVSCGSLNSCLNLCTNANHETECRTNCNSLYQ